MADDDPATAIMMPLPTDRERIDFDDPLNVNHDIVEQPSSIPGVGPEVETTHNALGAGQSNVPYRFDLVDGRAMFEMTKVLKEGADKYGAGNWRGISVEDHLNHLIMHAYAYLAGDVSDKHLSHIMCRAMFAQGVSAQGGPRPPSLYER